MHAETAVIDIGSNSVRLVIYQGKKQVFNDKTLCGLGATAGVLARASQDKTLRTLQRFAAIMAERRTTAVIAVATAAVREARNRSSFLNAAEAALGSPIKVLSGEEEARLAALGVVAGFPGASGTMGDLGGGSLELALLKRGTIEKLISLPYGVLRNTIDFSKIAGIDWLRGETFYAVGGTWRVLARLWRLLNDNDQQNLIHERMTRVEVALLAAQLMELLKAGKARKIAEKRLPYLPYALNMLQLILATTGAKEVVFTGFGLREGCLHHLPAAPRV